MVLPRSSRVSRAPPYSWIVFVLPVRGYHPLRPSFPERSSYINTITGLVRVRSPLLTESQLMSFPPGTEMFQFSGFAPSRVTLQCRVSPFGNLRIKGCLHLPTAYRSMPRPSSPLVAKASIRCSYQDTCLKRFLFVRMLLALTTKTISTSKNSRCDPPKWTTSPSRSETNACGRASAVSI